MASIPVRGVLSLIGIVLGIAGIRNARRIGVTGRGTASAPRRPRRVSATAAAPPTSRMRPISRRRRARRRQLRAPGM